jgi:signal peptidase II
VRGLQERRTVTTLTGGGPAVSRRASTGAGRLAVASGVASAVVVVDQLTKWWAVRRLASGPIHVVGTLDLELSRNTGSAFNLFQGQSALLALVAVVLVAALSALAWRSPSRGRAAIIGLILGGALGNLCDRLFRDDHGAVVDFVDLHFWPTFNAADAAITVGCALLVVSLLRPPRAA